jgi:hypothetical protein
MFLFLLEEKAAFCGPDQTRWSVGGWTDVQRQSLVGRMSVGPAISAHFGG